MERRGREEGRRTGQGRGLLTVAAAATGQHYDYTAPAFDFRCRLVYDQSGLVPDYPGIAVRAG